MTLYEAYFIIDDLFELAEYEEVDIEELLLCYEDEWTI